MRAITAVSWYLFSIITIKHSCPDCPKIWNLCKYLLGKTKISQTFEVIVFIFWCATTFDQIFFNMILCSDVIRMFLRSQFGCGCYVVRIFYHLAAAPCGMVWWLISSETGYKEEEWKRAWHGMTTGHSRYHHGSTHFMPKGHQKSWWFLKYLHKKAVVRKYVKKKCWLELN